jgi:hypothetical protein
LIGFFMPGEEDQKMHPKKRKLLWGDTLSWYAFYPVLIAGRMTFQRLTRERFRLYITLCARSQNWPTLSQQKQIVWIEVNTRRMNAKCLRPCWTNRVNSASVVHNFIWRSIPN